MNLSAENIGQIRELVRSGYPLKARDAQDLLGHNDHLIELLEARGRLMLGVEIERDQLKAEVAGLKTGYEAYERVNAEMKAENERLRYQIGVLQSDANSWQSGYDVGRHMGTKTVWAERRAVRKDAERYRWLRRAGNTKAIALVAEHCLDALDETIDAALGLGEQS